MSILSNRMEFGVGRARTRVNLSAMDIGNDIFICIYNENAHIGAIAIGEYSPFEERVSVSLITKLGHKDDIIAQKAAYTITHNTKKTCCVIAGVHVDEITKTEITKILQNSAKIISKYISLLNFNK